MLRTLIELTAQVTRETHAREIAQASADREELRANKAEGAQRDLERALKEAMARAEKWQAIAVSLGGDSGDDGCPIARGARPCLQIPQQNSS